MKTFQLLTSAVFAIGIISAIEQTGSSGADNISLIADRGHILNDMNLKKIGNSTVRICANNYPYYLILHNSGKTLEYHPEKKAVYLADLTDDLKRQVFQIVKTGGQNEGTNELDYLILTLDGQPIAKNFYESTIILLDQPTSKNPVMYWYFDSNNQIRNGIDCLDFVQNRLKVRSCQESHSSWTLEKVNRVNKLSNGCLSFLKNELFLTISNPEAFKISRVSDYLKFKSKNLTLSEKNPIKKKSLFNISIKIGTDAGELWEVNRHGQIINKKTGKCLSHRLDQVTMESCTVFGISDQSWKFESENK